MNLEGALTWAFEFEDQQPFAGFRQLASAGLDLPVLNVFRMFGRMHGQQLMVTSSSGLDADTIRRAGVRGRPDVSACASLDGHQLAVLVWHYHDEDVPGPDAAVDLYLKGLPLASGHARLTHYRIDAHHSNSYDAWRRMGSPLPLSPTQYAQLEQAGQLATLGPPEGLDIKQHTTQLKFTLPRQAVSLLVVDWN